MVTALPALATRSPCASASLAALSISAALSPTETMKCDAMAALSDISPVVWFCSATAPLTLSNTGRIASIACEIRCTASTEPAASFCSASIFLRDLLGGVLGLHRQRLDLGGDHRKAAPGGAGPRRLDGGVERQQRGLPRDLRDQVDDIADRGRGFAQAIDVEAGFAGGGAGLIGELARRRAPASRCPRPNG